MKYTSTLLIIFLLLTVKPARSQSVSSSSPHLSTLDSISSDDAKKMAIEDFLKFRPGYKLVSFRCAFSNKGMIEMITCKNKKDITQWEWAKDHAVKGTVIIFDYIDVMNGEKKIHLIQKCYVIK